MVYQTWIKSSWTAFDQHEAFSPRHYKENNKSKGVQMQMPCI